MMFILISKWKIDSEGAGQSQSGTPPQSFQAAGMQFHQVA